MLEIILYNKLNVFLPLICQDIDECELGTDDCHEYGTCHNTDGDYNCTCNSGFSGNGTTCESEL